MGTINEKIEKFYFRSERYIRIIVKWKCSKKIRCHSWQFPLIFKECSCDDDPGNQRLPEFRLLMCKILKIPKKIRQNIPTTKKKPLLLTNVRLIITPQQSPHRITPPRLRPSIPPHNLSTSPPRTPPKQIFRLLPTIP